MRITRVALLLVVLVALPVMSPSRASADRHVKITDYEEGHAYCPRRAVVIGAMIVPAGRCYQLWVLRDRRGAFLAFMDPRVRLRAGRIERLDNEEGRQVRGHILFLVPMQNSPQLVLVPVNTIQLIRLREEDEENNQEGDQGDEGDRHVTHSKLIVMLPSMPVPNIAVTIVATF